MYHMELKGIYQQHFGRKVYCLKFLMYRVELKVEWDKVHLLAKRIVPNVPCGVERQLRTLQRGQKHACPVPNVPCGVESLKYPLSLSGKAFSS